MRVRARVRVRVRVTPNLNSTGAAGLMRGAAMRVLWIAPQGCVYYPVYEAVQSCRPRELTRELRRELHSRLGRQVVIGLGLGSRANLALSSSIVT